MGKSYISKVRYEGRPHVVIAVMHPNGKVVARGALVEQIGRGVEYWTVPHQRTGAKVHVVGGKFLSIDPNEKRSDNLGVLPEF